MKITKQYLGQIIKEVITEQEDDLTDAAGAKSALQQKAGGGEAIRTQLSNWVKPLTVTPNWKKMKAAIEKGGPTAQLQAIDLLLNGPESLVGLSSEAVQAFANQLATAAKKG